MKGFSIKTFSLSVVAILYIVMTGLFVNFYFKSKENVSTLLRDDIQTKILSLRHFLKTNMEVENPYAVTAYLDNAVATNILIKDVHIVSQKHKIIYTTDRKEVEYHRNISCLPVIEIERADIFKQRCYTFQIRLFKKFTPHYFTVHVYTDLEYIDSLFYNHVKNAMIFFVLFSALFLFTFYSVMRRFIILPLEKLREFAISSTNPPGSFLISELEWIRLALIKTFKRLKKEQEKLYKLSTQDPLSGLFNRKSLIEKLDWLVSKNSRFNEKFALVFIDLDDFKNINDTLGHEYGDELLKEVAKQLVGAVRDNDIVSRFGGDEFVIVLPEIEEEVSIVNVLERITAIFKKPLRIKESNIVVTMSMGVAVFPKDGKDTNTLLKHADIAMYLAKADGKNRYHFFTESLNKYVEEKVKMQKLMQKALENGWFELYYQPKVDLATNKIVACEALVRLNDPERGVLSPDSFIPVAEQNGFIIVLGEWILQEACKQIRLWSPTALKDVKVSVNVSGTQFEDENLLLHIEKCLNDIDPKMLDIELTESVLIKDIEIKIAKLDAIKRLGVSLSLDDFGTGYSSLSYLKKIPYDTIKVDKGFIDSIDDEQDAAFVEMIVKIAKQLRLEIVAEGVESERQLQLVKELGCDMYQGYYCSKPLRAKDFEALFHANL